MWPLINHPFYFRCWADLLASFLFPPSCHCCFFSASLFTCFPLAGFIRQFPPRKMQTLLPALSWGSEKGSEAESWVQHSSVVCAHFEVCSWLLISGKSCLWFSGPAITLCTQTTAQGKQPGESCHISGIFMMHYGKKNFKETIFLKMPSTQVSLFSKLAQDLEIRSPKDPLRTKILVCDVSLSGLHLTLLSV